MYERAWPLSLGPGGRIDGAVTSYRSFAHQTVRVCRRPAGYGRGAHLPGVKHI